MTDGIRRSVDTRRRTSNNPWRRRGVLVIAGTALGLAQAAAGQQVVANWLGATSGTWDSPGRWSSNPFFPNNDSPAGTTYAVVAPAGSYTLTVNTNATVDSIDLLGGTLRIDQHVLTLAGNGPINLSSGARLRLFFGTLRNAVVNLGSTTEGLYLEQSGNTLDNVTINGSSILSDNSAAATVLNGLTLNGTLRFRNRVGGLVFGNSQTISAGTFYFDDPIGSPQTRILSVAHGSSVTLAPAVTIRAHLLRIEGPSSSGELVNQGRIYADVPGEVIDLQGRIENTGTLEALNGATVQLAGNGWSSSGVLRAGAGSVLNLFGQGSIAGSTIDAAGAINVRAALNHEGSALALSGPSGSITLGSGGSISGGTLTTDGGASLRVSPGAGALSNVGFDGDLIIAPDAALVFNGGSLAGHAAVGTGGTLSFQGAWASTGLIEIDNGTLDLGGTFSLPAGFGLQRTGGTVNLTGALDNTGSALTLDASTGSWNLNGGSVSGGTLRFLDGAALVPTSSSANRLTGVTLEGTLPLANAGARVRVSDGLSGGRVQLTGADAVIGFEDTQTLSSEVVFAGPAGNQARLSVDSGAVLTIAPGTHVHGGSATVGGSVFTSGAGAIVNQGLISADVPAQVLTIDAGASPLTNEGVMRAVGGGTLAITGLTGNTGLLEASGAGSTLSLTGSYTINTPVSVTGGATLFLSGSWTNAGGISLTDSTLRLGGTYTTAQLAAVNRTNSTIRAGGTWNNAGSTISLDAANPIVLGGGTISGGVIDAAGGGYLAALPATSNTLTGVTLNADLNLAGATLNTTNLVLNNVANLSAGATMSLNGSWANNGTINVNAATLVLGGTVSSVGTINRTGGASVTLGGTLNAPNETVTISPTSLLTGIANGTLHADTLSLVDNPVLAMNGGAVRAGHISGNGTITVANSAALTPPSPSPTGTLTIEPGVTIRGSSGWLGHVASASSSDTVTNNGVIRVDAAGIGVNVRSRNFVNAGLVEITNNGSFYLSRTTDNEIYTDWTNSGTIRIESGELSLGGHFSTADIGTIEHVGGSVYIRGQLDNTDATLSLDTPWLLLSSSGRITGGTIDIDPATELRIGDHAGLTGVTVNGDIRADLVEVREGLTLHGTASVAGSLQFIGGQAVQAGDFDMLGGAIIGQGGTVTLAPSVLVHGRGLVSPNLVNEGRIAADVPGATLSVQGNVENLGVIEAVDQATLDLNTATFTNNGVVRAANGGRVNLGGSDMHLSGGSLVNDGGSFAITGTLANAGSLFTVGGAVGDIEFTGRINGGTVAAVDAGRLVIPSSSSGPATLDGVTVDAPVHVHRTLQVVNDLTLSNTVHLEAGSASGLRFLGAANTLSGGTVSLEGADSHRIDLESGGSLTIGSDAVIRGGNGLLADDTGIGGSIQNHLVNNGRISADTAGRTMTIAADVFTNHGVVETTDGAVLRIAPTAGGVDPQPRSWSSDGVLRVAGGTLFLGGTFPSSSIAGLERQGGDVWITGTLDNTGDTLTLDGPEHVLLLDQGGPQNGAFVGSRLVGGTVNLLNDARLAVPAVREGGSAASGSLIDTVINGDLDVAGLLYLHNTELTGTTTLRGGHVLVGPPGEAQASSLESGEFLFVNEGAAFGRLSNPAAPLTLGPAVQVRGGHGTVVASVNHGTISADLASDVLVASIGENFGTLEAVNGGTLVLTPTGEGLVNHGLIRVVDSSLVFTGSTSVLNSVQRSNAHIALTGFVDNSGAVLSIDADTDWEFQNGLYLKGGVLDVPGGSLQLGSGSAQLGPVTFDGVSAHGDMHTLPSAEQVNIRNGLTLDGTLSVPTPGAIVSFVGDQELSGGTIFFDPAGGNGERLLRLRGRGFNGAGSATLTVNAGTVLRGGDVRISTGTRGFTEATLVNYGLVSADVSNERITIEAPRFVNNGTVQALNGGQIVYEGPLPFGPGDPLVFENNVTVSIGPGSLFEADLFQQGRTGLIELFLGGAESRGDHGVVDANYFIFDGALAVRLTDGFVPSFGDRFDLFDFRSRQGEFTVLSLPQLPGALAWQTGDLYRSGAITVVPTPATLGVLTIGMTCALRRRRR